MNALASIRARLTLTFSASLAALLLLACVGLTWNARHNAERAADTVLDAVTRKIEREWQEDGTPSLAEIMADERDLSGENVALLLISPQGQIVHQSQERVPTWPLRADQQNSGWRVRTVKFRGDTVVVALDWRKTAQALRGQAVTLLMMSGVVLLAASGGAWFLVGQSLLPIARLSQQARETREVAREGGPLRLRAPSGDAEIVQLVATLNGLLARLHEAAAMRGRFYAAASHELRTPLQALSGHLELSLTRPRDAEAYHAVVQEAHAQTRRLTSLVRDLLRLNQLETAPLPPSETVNVTTLCASLLCGLDDLLVARHLRVAMLLPFDLERNVPPTHIEILLRNLLENAAKYASGDSEIRLEPLPDGLALSNACAPLAPADLPRLFEPFYRPDAARQMETGGNGLGLAICKAIADANGWTLCLVPMPDGLRCEISFTA